MTRAACSNCGTFVITTADPNDFEGWFVSLEVADRLDVELAASPGQYPRRLLNEMAQRIVLCGACQAEFAR